MINMSEVTQDSSAQPCLPAPLLAQASQFASRFSQDLLQADLHSPTFKECVNEAFRLGKTQTANVAGLMTGQFAKKFGATAENSQAYSALNTIRIQLDALDPSKQGDLSAPNKILGFIPYGSKLKNYFKEFEAASVPLQRSLRQLYAARDDMEQDEVELEALHAKLWESMEQLNAAIATAREIDTQLSTTVASLQSTDSARANAIEQEVLYYVRQNLQDMLTQQLVSLQGIAALEVLKKTARELQNGCTRVATTGMSALAVAQVVARATGNQIKVMNLLQETSASVENLMQSTSQQVGEHAQRNSAISNNTVEGLKKMQHAFSDAFTAIDSLTSTRNEALREMENTNLALRQQLEQAERYIQNAKN